MKNTAEKNGAKVYFKSDGKKLAALVYKPQNFNLENTYPALVVTRPASGVKEQTAGLYAQEFAKRGFITLVFDPKGFGESEGRTRVEDVYSIISDTKNAVSFLENIEGVDKSNIFNIGICMGSAYATIASIEDSRIKATGVISPILTNPEDAAKVYGSRFFLWGMLNSMKPIVAILNLFKIQMFVPLAPIKWSDKLFPSTKMQKLAIEYYGPGAPGDVPTWKNKINFYKGETGAIKLDPFKYIPQYNKGKKPYFMAFATGGCRPEKLKEFYDQIDSVDKELLIIPNSNHFDLYYKPQHVKRISDDMSNLFKRQIA